jgi:hypothetical protein
MMHSACSPAATPRETRGGVQPAYGRATFAACATRVVDFEGNDEPSLDELMGDDVIRRVMARDGVQPDQVWSLMDAMRNRLR